MVSKQHVHDDRDDDAADGDEENDDVTHSLTHSLAIYPGLEVRVLDRIRFAEPESGSGLDSVKSSVQCANPNPDSRVRF